MAKKAAEQINERALTKGELRKLNALRKSIGEELGERAFVEWFRKKSDKAMAVTRDRNAEKILAALQPLIDGGELTIRRGGYRIRRGRGRIIVEPARGD
ncbi:MAG: hypothetical protein QF893_07710 [Alphaproteobacteria bacterium]|jgi:hypothetical protein|nr:hypothetical protein [Alphaproteobacteria bacterium]